MKAPPERRHGRTSARALALAAASVLASSPHGTADAVAFPADNSQPRFREDPALWTSVWGPYETLDGQACNTQHPLDLNFFSTPARARPAIADWLYPFQFEREFEGAPLGPFCRTYWWLSYTVAVLYVIAVKFGQRFMKDRQAWDLKGPLAAWNLFLAVYSFIGVVRVVPHLLGVLYVYGFDYTLCRRAVPLYGNGPPGLWVSLFIFSKYFELIDTLFLVLRKKPVNFLHWYHHFSVLVYCWHAFVWEMPSGIYFVSMNYSVHSIMYFYYFLAAVCKKPPRWALLVTIMQLSQMAVGVAVTLSHLQRLTWSPVENCDGHIPNLWFALGMYASYFYLFAEFLVKRYCLKSRKADSGGKKAVKEKTNGTAAKKLD
mmetsp:Transcript_28627/g.62286  ORF Transcript_28627/g.62286 Transcript_28627/m.62286 type:complete len:373 (-) Transcript_28627:213-1331(-)